MDKEVDFKDIDVEEIRQIAIKNYVESRMGRNLQVESIVKAFITYTKHAKIIVKDGKVYENGQ